MVKFTLGADSIPGADSNLGSDSTPGADSSLPGIGSGSGSFVQIAFLIPDPEISGIITALVQIHDHFRPVRGPRARQVHGDGVRARGSGGDRQGLLRQVVLQAVPLLRRRGQVDIHAELVGTPPRRIQVSSPHLLPQYSLERLQ